MRKSPLHSHTYMYTCAYIVFIFCRFLFYWGSPFRFHVQLTPDNSGETEKGLSYW